MKSYMPQADFNMCAVMAALCHDNLGVERCAGVASETMREAYLDDDFEKDIAVAAHKVVEIFQTAFPGKPIGSAVKQMQYCIKTYHPNGMKRDHLQEQLKLQTQPIPNRISQCLIDIMVFHMGTLSGTFPIVPKGWSL